MAYGLFEGVSQWQGDMRRQASRHFLSRIFCEVISLALHGAYSAVLNECQVITREDNVNTHSEEHPLQHLAVLFGMVDRTESKLVLLIERCLQVSKDGACLKHVEAIMGDGGDASIRVDLEEPRRLDLVVHLSNIRV